MAWKFNPFTGALDQTGSKPDSYIDGEVATYSDLPLSSTTAPLNSAWLVRGSSGVWPFTKPGGVYIRTATGGSSRDADYTYAGIFPDVFSDANFTLYDDGDSTKNAKFQLSGISAGTTRTLTVPNASGTITLDGHTHIFYGEIVDSLLDGGEQILADIGAAASSHTHAASAISDSTTAGRALLTAADAAAQRTSLGLGTLATQSGTFSGTSSGTNTGDQTISLTGDVAGSGTGSFAATIASNAVTNAKLAQVATSTLKGRATAATGNVEDLTATQVRSLLNVADGATANSSDATLLARANHTGTQNVSTLTAGNWKLFYSNGSGAVTELALGSTSGHVLQTNGASSAPSFAAVSAGATNLWIPASAWIPRTTNGCGVNSLETSTNKVNYDVLEFDAAAVEYAQAALVMPSNWNAGTVTCKFHWTAASGSGSVVWQLSGRAYGDNAALDAATGTVQTVTDALQTAAYEHITAATSAITLAGSPAAGQMVIFELSRLATDSADTLAVDGRFLGAEISFN